MNLDPLRELSSEWRARADVLRSFGAPDQAEAVERCAGQLEERVTDWWTEALPLKAGAEESGYSYDRLQRLVARGEIENVGKPGEPLVRRCDLPRKGERSGTDVSDDLLSVRRKTG